MWCVGVCRAVCRAVCRVFDLFLSAESGSVYGWGNGSIGQLGLGDHTFHWLPVPIKALRKMHVTQLAAGYAHTIVVLSTFPLPTMFVEFEAAAL